MQAQLESFGFPTAGSRHMRPKDISFDEHMVGYEVRFLTELADEAGIDVSRLAYAESYVYGFWFRSQIAGAHGNGPMRREFVRVPACWELA